MKILMLGWEFPPFGIGGLATACYDLVRGLKNQDCEITLVLPKKTEVGTEFLKKIISTDIKVNITTVNSLLTPYMTSENYQTIISYDNAPGIYGENLFLEVERYTQKVKELVKNEEFDIIHAHDWMTYQAGIEIKNMSNKPLILHMHATENDRTSGHPNPYISHIEYTGMEKADVIISNSNWTKQNVIKDYQIEPDKIEIVHWGIDENNPAYNLNYVSPLKKNNKIVLFLGRVTVQKGPDYFIEAARRVLDYEPNTKFMFCGSGDMMPKIIERVAELNMNNKFIFTGRVQGDEVHKAFQTADVYVMPSVSEPFGLVALESLKNNTPIIISKQSGCSEILNHCLKVNFWDVDELSNKLISVLRHSELLETLRENGSREVKKFNLNEPAIKCMKVYNKAISRRKNKW